MADNSTLLIEKNSDSKIFCGERQGSWGEAYLVSDNDLLVLSQQGRSSDLLDQFDDILLTKGHEEGSENGKKYCAKYLLGDDQTPRVIIDACGYSKNCNLTSGIQ